VPSAPHPDGPAPGSRRREARARIAAKRAAEQATVRAERRRRRLGAALALAGLAVVVVVVIAVQGFRTHTVAAAASPRNTAPGTDGAGFQVGDDSAPVVVDLYEDFQCPACRQFEEQSGATLDALVGEGTMRLRYRPIAILDRSSSDEYSTRALNAAAVVADESGDDAFLAFHDALFAHQPAEGSAGLSDAQLTTFADEVGASGTAVQEDIRQLRFADWTARVTDQASRAGVTATPTVLVNGRQITDRSPAGVLAAVQSAAAG
jgi:protein-disulfide isomerase